MDLAALITFDSYQIKFITRLVRVKVVDNISISPGLLDS